jgi:2-keto-4-pentenoate hydratase/2-oxohepta-3-ene-1,7-dioic acid hydratase in catechol pathway
MKFAFFNDFTLGVARDNMIVDVSDAVKSVHHVTPQDLISGVISNYAQLKPALEKAAKEGKGVPMDSVRIRPPLPKPTHLVAMAVNYMEFGALKTPPKINAFLKSNSCIIGNGDTIVLPDTPATIFHHECELALVIGKTADKVKRADAYNYIFGYVNFIDVSARGVGNGSFYWQKSWDTFGPMGPFLVTADEIKTPQNLPMRLWVNGQPRHDFSTSDMAHNIPECVEWVTAINTMEPGDIITTGTNHQGIGAIQDGDVVEMEGQGLGRLKVTVKDAKKRSWPRGIDKAFADMRAGRTAPTPAAPAAPAR